jgi:hypothetical protein
MLQGSNADMAMTAPGHERSVGLVESMSAVPPIASKISNINGLTNLPGEPQKVGLDATDAHSLETGAAR